MGQQGQRSRLGCGGAWAGEGGGVIVPWSGVRFWPVINFIGAGQGMLWSEPWLEIASRPEGTRIPPPQPILPTGLSFRWEDRVTAEWLAFVGTALSVEAAQQRLGAGRIASLIVVDTDERVATCVLRPVEGQRGVWNLETFVARPRGLRRGELLLHCLMWELWHFGPGATLLFQWELQGMPALLGAWWRGWLAASVRTERGWRWRRAAEQASCGFCAVTAAWIPPAGGAIVGICEVEGVQVVDSGLCDGWGYVLSWSGVPDWSRVAAAGGWRELWFQGSHPPPGNSWTWTGEWIVHGRVGAPLAVVVGGGAHAEIPFTQ